MRKDWDKRARENARHYVETSRDNWTDEDFFASGEKDVAEEIMTDMMNVCQGKRPQEMRVLEIGCGAGRQTRALANLFGEVHAVDISGEMISRARVALADQRNLRLYQNNGYDLSVIPALEFDFAYSSIVFQHIPSQDVIQNYVRETSRLLRPGALFKFQVQGYPLVDLDPNDTWTGVSFSRQDAILLAEVGKFELRHSIGEGTQYFWLWFFKK